MLCSSQIHVHTKMAYQHTKFDDILTLVTFPIPDRLGCPELGRGRRQGSRAQQDRGGAAARPQLCPGLHPAQVLGTQIDLSEVGALAYGQAADVAQVFGPVRGHSGDQQVVRLVHGAFGANERRKSRRRFLANPAGKERRVYTVCVYLVV